MSDWALALGDLPVVTPAASAVPLTVDSNDNLGTRAFSWLKRLDREFDQVLVSDAGKPFQVLGDASLGIIGQSMRATDILWDRQSRGQADRRGIAKSDHL